MTKPLLSFIAMTLAFAGLALPARSQGGIESCLKRHATQLSEATKALAPAFEQLTKDVQQLEAKQANGDTAKLKNLQDIKSAAASLSKDYAMTLERVSTLQSAAAKLDRGSRLDLALLNSASDLSFSIVAMRDSIMRMDWSEASKQLGGSTDLGALKPITFETRISVTQEQDARGTTSIPCSATLSVILDGVAYPLPGQAVTAWSQTERKNDNKDRIKDPPQQVFPDPRVVRKSGEFDATMSDGSVRIWVSPPKPTHNMELIVEFKGSTNSSGNGSLMLKCETRAPLSTS